MSSITLVTLNPQRVLEHVKSRLAEISDLTNDLIDFYAEQMMKEKTTGMFKRNVYKNIEAAKQAAVKMKPMQSIKLLYDGEIELLLFIKKEAEELLNKGIESYQVPHSTLVFLGKDFNNDAPLDNQKTRLNDMMVTQEVEPDLLNKALEEEK